jgi:hypothetical protein
LYHVPTGFRVHCKGGWNRGRREAQKYKEEKARRFP